MSPGIPALPNFQDLTSVIRTTSPARRRQAETRMRISTSSLHRGGATRPHRVPDRRGRRRCPSISGGNRQAPTEVHLILLIIDERPEEVTHFRRAVKPKSSPRRPLGVRRAHQARALAMDGRGRSGRRTWDTARPLTRLGRPATERSAPAADTMSGGVDNRRCSSRGRSSGPAHCKAAAA